MVKEIRENNLWNDYLVILTGQQNETFLYTWYVHIVRLSSEATRTFVLKQCSARHPRAPKNRTKSIHVHSELTNAKI
jgi:hypothetical protein